MLSLGLSTCDLYCGGYSMDSVRNATFRIGCSAAICLSALHSLQVAGQTYGGFFILKWQYSLWGKASRAYRTLRGASFISENGIAHFGRASRWTDIWRLLYPEMAILTLGKASRAYRTLRGLPLYPKMA